MTSAQSPRVGLIDLFLTFFKLGATSWGGFALMSAAQAALVTERKLITQQQYSDALALAWLMPGPVGGNLTVRLGFLLRGRAGAVATAAGSLLPSLIVMCLLAHGFDRIRQHPTAVAALLSGLTPAVCAVIIAAGVRQARASLADRLDVALAALAGLCLLSVNGPLLPVLLLGSSAWVSARLRRRGAAGGLPLAGWAGVRPSRATLAASMLLAACLLTLPFPSVLGAAPAWLQVGAGMAGASLTMFGGGLIAVPVLHQLCVETFHWTSAGGLASAIAASQISPGPLLTSTIFIGYQWAGIVGALAAAAGTFGPPGLLTLGAGSVLTALREWPPFDAAAMRGVRAAVVGLTVASAWQIARGADLNWLALPLFAVLLFLLLKTRCTTWLLVPFGGLVGLLLNA